MPWANHIISKRLRGSFPIKQDLYYQCGGKRIFIEGIGQTLSSREIHGGTTRSSCAKIRLTMKWPLALGNTCQFELELSGWVLQSEPGMKWSDMNSARVPILPGKAAMPVRAIYGSARQELYAASDICLRVCFSLLKATTNGVREKCVEGAVGAIRNTRLHPAP